MSSLLRRGLRVLTKNPAEALDRARNRWEARRERTAAPEPIRRTREQIRADLGHVHGLRVDDDWEARLHAWLGAPWPCPAQAGFSKVWEELAAELRIERDAGSGLDADPALARAQWCVVRHLRPARVVETGVSRGISSRLMLEALELNDAGRLWSIDLPPQADEWRALAGSAVPDRLRGRWTFVRGVSRRRLPPLLRELGTVDVFVHDSQHTERNMRFELGAAWPHLRPGGFVICDDAHENRAFAELAQRSRAPEILVAQEEVKAGLFGLARAQ